METLEQKLYFSEYMYLVTFHHCPGSLLACCYNNRSWGFVINASVVGGNGVKPDLKAVQTPEGNQIEPQRVSHLCFPRVNAARQEANQHSGLVRGRRCEQVLTSPPSVSASFVLLSMFRQLSVRLHFCRHTCRRFLVPRDRRDVWGEECRVGDSMNLDAGRSLGSWSVWQLSPSPQGHRWKSSGPRFAFWRCRVQTCPSRNTGLQIRVQR